MSKGNLKTQGLKGNNFPYQFNVLQLLGMIAGNTDQVEALLQAIEDNTDGVEGLLSQILNAVQSDKDFEASFVKDTNGQIWLEVRTLDLDTNVWTIAYFLPGDLTPHQLQPGDPAGPLGPLTYESPASILALILTALSQFTFTGGDLNTSSNIQVEGTDVSAVNPVPMVLPTGTQGSRYVRTIGATPVVIAPGNKEVSIKNLGTDDITVDTGLGPEILDPGVGINFRSEEGKKLGAYTIAGSSASSKFIYTSVI